MKPRAAVAAAGLLLGAAALALLSPVHSLVAGLVLVAFGWGSRKGRGDRRVTVLGVVLLAAGLVVLVGLIAVGGDTTTSVSPSRTP